MSKFKCHQINPNFLRLTITHTPIKLHQFLIVAGDIGVLLLHAKKFSVFHESHNILQMTHEGQWDMLIYMTQSWNVTRGQSQCPASTERARCCSLTHTAKAEVRPHHQWRSRSTTLAARSAENWIQSAWPGVQVSKSSRTNIPHWTVLTSVSVSQSWPPLFHCTWWPCSATL